MAGPNERIVGLLQKSLFKEELNEAESAELQQWRQLSPYNEEVWEQVNSPVQFGQALQQLYESDQEKLWGKVLQQRQPRSVPFRKIFRYAAAVILLAAVCTYLWWQRTPTSPQQTAHQEFLPGSNKAVLTLSDGSAVMLDSAGKKNILQGKTKILQQNGQLVYAADRSDEATLYNTLTTPRGGQFMLNLPDGSRVWLNAASSLRYPTAFNGQNRVVELNGEAYFEVAQAKMPFRVKAGPMQVDVLGTHFNVMAYQDEKAIRATLLQGSVKVAAGTTATIIRPGEQGVLDTGGEAVQVLPVNTEETIAWKNGYFWFTKADLTTVMRQLGRWYDVEIVYEGKIDNRQLTGKFYRSYNLSQVLSILEANNIHGKIEQKKLIINMN